MDLAAAVAAVADKLTAAGIRSTPDLRDLNPPCVYVAAPTLAYRFGKGGADLTWQIVAVVPNSGRLAALKALSPLIDSTVTALGGAVTAGRPVDVTALDGGAPLPGYELTLTTRAA